MMRIYYNQKGFSAVEVVLIVAIISIISSVSYFVLATNKSIDKTYQSTVNSSLSTPVLKKTSSSSTKTQKTTNINQIDLPTAKVSTTAIDYYGSAEVSGFPEDIKINKDDYCTNNCAQEDYIFFHIVHSDDTKLLDFMNALKGNAFVKDNAIGIGCLIDGQISYYNVSDVNGDKNYTITKDDTAKIMAATSSSLITLDLTRLRLTGGGDASTCYSHITTLNIK